jgi:crotonobetainyl-CoA:carnitine CoA-transferase CaiB-like acyl-CoA transferase
MTRAIRLNQSRPLHGVVVLDFTRVLSGPHATRMLADLGAEVIKVEPPSGDLTRFSAPRVNSLSTYFVQQNTGKENVSVDLDKDDGRDLVARMIERVDVVVENFRPGVMDKWGLDFAAMSVRNPRLVYVSISGFGADGPWVDRRAYAPVVNAEAGITKSQGDARDGRYANDPHSHADVYTGMHAATAAIAALYQREHTGRGQYIDVSMAEVMLYANEHAHDALWLGDPPRGVIRSFQPGDYPVLTTADGTVLIASGHPAENGTFEYYLAAMNAEELADDDRFRTVADRLEHLDELQTIIREWANTCRDFDDIAERLARRHIAVGRLRTADDLANTDWARDRRAIVEVSDRGSGTVRLPNSPWHFSDSDTSVSGEPRYRGEDNRKVLAQLLGLSVEEIEAYEHSGTISSRGPR